MATAEKPLQTPDRISLVRLVFLGSNFFQLNLPCYHSLAVFLPQPGTHPHATFESGKKLRSPQSSSSQLAGQQALLFRWC
jgi:hypothetical protein